MTIGGHTFINDGEPSLGDMSFSEALIQSCDTVYYNIGYEMYQTDDTKANCVLSAKAPIQKMQQMELDWGFGNYTGVDLPEESTGTIPTRQWLYNMWEDNAHKGQNWCKNGKAERLVRAADRVPGLPLRLGVGARPGGDRRDRPGIRDRHAAAARQRLYRARQRRHAVQPAARRGAGLRRPGRCVQKINPPVIRHLPVSSYTLAYIRTALAGVVTQGTAAGRVRRVPARTRSAWRARPVPRRSWARTPPRCSPPSRRASNPQYVVVVMLPNSGYGADAAAPAVRQIWDGIYGLEGHKAALPGGQVPATSMPTVQR